MFGESVRLIIHGLVRIHELYSKNPVIESENFRNLLLSFAVVFSKSNVTVISLSLPKLSRTKNFSSERLALVER